MYRLEKSYGTDRLSTRAGVYALYQAHWQLREAHCRDGLDPRFFYESPIHNEALARLHFLVDQRRLAGLLLGDSGTGKSLLLEMFARQLDRAGTPVACVDLLGIDRRELLWQTACAWGMGSIVRDDEFRMWRRVTDRMIEHRLQQLPSVLLLDNADEAATDVLTSILRLAQFDATPEASLTVVLSARPEGLRQLGSRLLDLAVLRIDLAAWDEEETAGYLNAALAETGRPSPAFGASALHRLHELSRGIPRHVHQLADLALLAGAGQQLAEIDPATVEAVYTELGVT